MLYEPDVPESPALAPQAVLKSRLRCHRRHGRENANQSMELTASRFDTWVSTRECFPRPDLCAAKKCRIFINHQPRRFDVTAHRATCLELAAFSRENIALHRPSHLQRFRPDLGAYLRVLPDRECSGSIDFALHLAVDE